MNLQVKFTPLVVNENKSVFDVEIVGVVSVDDSEFARLQFCKKIL